MHLMNSFVGECYCPGDQVVQRISFVLVMNGLAVVFMWVFEFSWENDVVLCYVYVWICLQDFDGIECGWWLMKKGGLILKELNLNSLKFR